LSDEDTPTLCYSIPAFESFIGIWSKVLESKPEWETFIQPGLSKLEEYENRLTDVHVLAMGVVN
jgi:hypothetical protein